ncbi:MAG: 4-hydroxy-tetrahydrodipicolinate synthase [Acidobacteria bacterium]|nr:4-hydroxy-tetrahydrodipicolinate synthase [Acidobacteriota bacterium]
MRGCGTALVTPLRSDGEVDLESFRDLIQWQIASGIHFLVPCGTTGESATLSEREYRDVISTCVRSVNGRVPILAGAGSNNTEHAKHLARIAEDAGADAILTVAPYYNKPTQEGLFLHFREIARSVKIPLILYNVPGRTSSNILPDTLFRLAEQVENIAGVKEASGDLGQIMNVLRGRPARFRVLSGDDSFALSVVALGGEGVISVASNIIPSEMSELMELALAGDFDKAREVHYRFLPLMNLNFIESNPIPVKYALFRMGKIEESYRLPLCPLADASKKRMDQELERLNLLTTRV